MNRSSGLSRGAHPLPDGKGGRALRQDVLQCRDRGSGHRADRSEHPGVVRVEEGLRRRVLEQRPQFLDARPGKQPPKRCRVPASGAMAAAHHRGEKGAPIAPPFVGGRIAAGRYQTTRQLLNVVAVVDFGEQVPFDGLRLKRVQHHIAAITVEKTGEIAAVRIGKDGAVAALQGRAQQLADRGGFSGARGADELEVLGFLLRCDADSGQGQMAAAPMAQSRAMLFRVGQHHAALVRIIRFAPAQPR